MESTRSNTMMVAALGRHFSLGKLYDCRQDALIPSMTLWGRNDLENHVVTKKQSYNDFQISSSETISEKTSSLSLGLSLKASFVFGLVHISGSAEYLHNTKKSRRQARVTLKYEGTTEFKELSMEHLGKVGVKYPEVFGKGIATHVVTGILYGAQAIFVFDCDVTEDESQQEYENHFSGILKSISNVILKGTGLVSTTGKDIKIVEKFSCKYHGDFFLKKPPTCFQDVLEIYKDLPTMLQEGAIPLKVWMVPLASLDSSAAKMVFELSAAFVEETLCVVEYFTELEARCNDILRNTKQEFSQISKKIKDFKKTCLELRKNFQQTLGKKLPSIRAGANEESAPEEVIMKMKSSPFNSKTLNEWMDHTEREVDTLMFFLSLMKNTRTVPSQVDLYKEVLSVEHAVCFVFTSIESNERYLSALSEYVRVKTSKGDFQDRHVLGREKERWYSSEEVLDDTRKKVKLFSDFAEANKENKTIKFLAAGLKDEKHKGSSIYLYEDGFTVSEDFEPPSKPEAVTVEDINHDSVTLKISPPRFGADSITSYSVEFCVKGEDEWKQTTGPKSGDVTVSDLRPNTEYEFRCRAVTSLGVGPASNITMTTPSLQ